VPPTACPHRKIRADLPRLPNQRIILSPYDIETLQRLLLASNAELAQARAEASSAEALIAYLRLTIEKLKREIFGPRNERKARLLDQMELELEELEAAATEDELAAEKAAAASGDTTQVRAFTRKRPARQPFPAHLPRERLERGRFIRPSTASRDSADRTVATAAAAHMASARAG
jgi:hypothetical protein